MLYSQLRIEDVQVAQIVCVVGRAEPGQDQQQQSLHGLFPLFSPSFSPLCTEALSSSILPASPSSSSTSNSSNSPNLAVLTPPPPHPPRLPSLSRGAFRSELLLHFLPFQPLSFPPLLLPTPSTSLSV